MLVVMAENFVPAAAREFFLVLRKRLMEFPRSQEATRNVEGMLREDFWQGLKEGCANTGLVMFNRPGVAGAVLCINSLVIN